jgi:hypothetical protein
VTSVTFTLDSSNWCDVSFDLPLCLAHVQWISLFSQAMELGCWESSMLENPVKHGDFESDLYEAHRHS